MGPTEGMPVYVSAVTKSFGPTNLFRDTTFHVPAGKITCILGRTGSGKSTLLRMISGLDNDFEGTIKIGSSEKKRNEKCSLLLQENRVYPRLSAIENVTLVQKARNRQGDATAKKLLEDLGLSDSLKQKAATLSGGEKTRVGIARALMLGRPIMLLDEPFAALDECVRWEIADTISSVHNPNLNTTVIVTHDQRLALHVADFLVIIDETEKRVAQVGPSKLVFLYPSNMRVATYLYGRNLTVLEQKDINGEDVGWKQLVENIARKAERDGVRVSLGQRVVTSNENFYYSHRDMPGFICLWRAVVPEASEFGSGQVYIRLKSGKRIVAKNLDGEGVIGTGNVYIDSSRGWLMS